MSNKIATELREFADLIESGGIDSETGGELVGIANCANATLVCTDANGGTESFVMQ